MHPLLSHPTITALVLCPYKFVLIFSIFHWFYRSFKAIITKLSFHLFSKELSICFLSSADYLRYSKYSRNLNISPHTTTHTWPSLQRVNKCSSGLTVTLRGGTQVYNCWPDLGGEPPYHRGNLFIRVDFQILEETAVGFLFGALHLHMKNASIIL